VPRQYHFFHGWTAETPHGYHPGQEQDEPAGRYFFQEPALICGFAEEIDHSANSVYVKMNEGSSRTLSYDHLLIGTGSYDSDEVEGISRYGYQVKSHVAYQQTKQAIFSIIRQAAATNPGDAARLLHFTIAGSGFSGVELVDKHC
jgi:NADH dehydrogenase FAD-containing subunit